MVEMMKYEYKSGWYGLSLLLSIWGYGANGELGIVKSW